MLSTYSILLGHTLPTRDADCLDHFIIKIDNKNKFAYTAVLNTSITDTIYWISLATRLTRTGPKLLVSYDYDQTVKNISTLKFSCFVVTLILLLNN